MNDRIKSASGADSEHPGDVVDARGLRCPIPVIRLAAAAKASPPGAVLTVLSTDPAARYDVPAWARMRGHELLGTQESVADDGTRAWAVSVRVCA